MSSYPIIKCRMTLKNQYISGKINKIERCIFLNNLQSISYLSLHSFSLVRVSIYLSIRPPPLFPIPSLSTRDPSLSLSPTLCSSLTLSLPISLSLLSIIMSLSILIYFSLLFFHHSQLTLSRTNSSVLKSRRKNDYSNALILSDKNTV